MSVKNFTKPVSPKAEVLVSRLAEELKHPAPGHVQPLILLEGGRGQTPSHVYVIWEDWRDIPAIDRSEMIMDAYEQAKGKKASLNVLVAMGLTSEEAKRLHIG